MLYYETYFYMYYVFTKVCSHQFLHILKVYIPTSYKIFETFIQIDPIVHEKSGTIDFRLFKRICRFLTSASDDIVQYLQ